MESKYRLGCWGVALLVLAAAGGCGGSGLDTVPVSGKVTYQGNPLPWGTVKFQPVNRMAGRPGMATIEGDGSYSVGTLENAEGLTPGEYKVMVYAEKTPVFTPSPEQQAAAAKVKLPTPTRYAKPNTSRFTLTINPGDGAKTLDLDLTK